jgi:N-acetylglutamate synthase-like GNAT family acetyltransferase
LGDHDQPPRPDLHDGAGRLGPYTISHELPPGEADLAYRWISQESYWAAGVPRPVFDRAMANSLKFVLRDADGHLCGIARVVTDRATFAYLCDVFIREDARGEGAGRRLLKAVLDHPDLQNLRRMILATRDAHELYRKFGFTPLNRPEVFMQRHDPDVYGRLNQASDAAS